MPDSPPPETLAWLRQTAAVDGAAYSQVLLHLLERVEALEQRPIPGFVDLAAPAPEAAPVATDEELLNKWAAGGTVQKALRAAYDLGRQHGAAQAPDALPAVPVAWGNFREDGTCVGLTEHFEDTTRWLNPRPLFLSFRPPAAQPAPPAPLADRPSAKLAGWGHPATPLSPADELEVQP
jgi:hypothetical protein